MSQLYASDGWLNHIEIEQPEIIYPIDRDLSARWIRRRYQGPASTYADIALDSVDAEFSDFFFVQQGPLENVDGGEVAYDRIFSNIPNIRDEYESTTYEYPAVQVVATPIALEITDLPAPNVITVPGHTLTVGTVIRVLIRYETSDTSEWGRGFGLTYNVSILSISGDDITINANFVVIDPSTGTGFSFTPESGQVISEFTAGRFIPEVMETQGVVRHEYFLPGVTGGITSPIDIPIEERFAVTLNASGVETKTVSGATTPNTLQYRQMVLNRELIVDSCTIRPWIGNIYEKLTRYVIAR